MKHLLTGSVVALVLAASASAQNVVLREDFNVAVPPAGWSQVKNNPLAQGWIKSTDGRAWHEDESSSIGACDDELISPVLDLAAVPSVYAHFKSQLNFAGYLANNPNSVGDGETDLYVRINGGSWVEAWTDTRVASTTDTISVDLSSFVGGQSNVEFALRYYGTFAHETWFDWIQIDDSATAPPPPPPPPVNWTVNLPGSFSPLTPGGTVTDDLEAYAGVLPSHMAATAINSTTGLPDPEAWCTIAGGTWASASGVRNLEMGLLPGSTNYHNVRNALVIGLDGTGTTGVPEVRFNAIDHGEETNAFDGVWISQDGATWYQVYGATVGWGPLPQAWTAVIVDTRSVANLTTGPFYLMFGQEDNFPYANLDGVGIDDISVDAGGSAGPALAKSGACPGAVTLDVSNCTASASIAVLYGPGGSYTQNNPSKPCLGLTIDIAVPSVGAVLSTDGAGAASLSFNAPGGACGLTVQVVDLTTCTATNTVVL